MGELLCPCLVQGSVGVVYPVRPQEEQPQWRGSSGNLDSAPAGTPSAGPGGSGAGPLICSAGAGASSLSWALPASACPGGGGILGCVPAPCAPEPALVDSRSRAAQPPPRSRRPSPSELLRVPPCALQPLGSSAHSPGAQLLCYCPREPEGIPALLGPAPTPCEPLSPGKVGAAPAPPGRGSPVLGTLAPASARLLAGPLPLGGLLFLYFFFPVFLP